MDLEIIREQMDWIKSYKSLCNDEKLNKVLSDIGSFRADLLGMNEDVFSLVLNIWFIDAIDGQAINTVRR